MQSVFACHGWGVAGRRALSVAVRCRSQVKVSRRGPRRGLDADEPIDVYSGPVDCLYRQEVQRFYGGGSMVVGRGRWRFGRGAQAERAGLDRKIDLSPFIQRDTGRSQLTRKQEEASCSARSSIS